MRHTQIDDGDVRASVPDLHAADRVERICASAPREVHIQVARPCNLKCTMCSWDTWRTTSGFMTLSLFDSILEKAARDGVKKIVIANAQGEPFLNPRIMEMIERAKSMGFWLMVSTNGTAFSDRRLQRLAQSGIDNIQFSFAGFDKESYERVYVGGRWDIVVGNLGKLVKALDDAGAATTISINGCVAAESLLDMSAVEFSHRTHTFLRTIGVMPPRAAVTIQLPHNFAGEIDEGDAQGASGIKSFYDMAGAAPTMCRVLENAPGVFTDGTVTACGCLDPNGELEIGDIAKDGFRDLRGGEAYRSMVGKFAAGQAGEIPLCKGCDLPYFDQAVDPLAAWWTPRYNGLNPAGADSVAAESAAAVVAQLEVHRSRLAAAIGEEAVGYLTGPDDPFVHATLMATQATGLRSILETVAGRAVPNLMIAPCTDHVESAWNLLEAQFETLRVADTHKAGEVVGRVEIEAPQAVPTLPEDCGFFIATDRKGVRESYSALLPDRTQFASASLQRALRDRAWASVDTGFLRDIGAVLGSMPEVRVILAGRVGSDHAARYADIEAENCAQGGITVLVTLRHRDGKPRAVRHDREAAVLRNCVVSLPEMMFLAERVPADTLTVDVPSFENVGAVQRGIQGQHAISFAYALCGRSVHFF